LKARIKKLEKKCKPSISHHRVWLKSVQSTFDGLDADHGMDYMDTEEPVNEGRLRDQPLVTESSSSHNTTQDSRDSLEGTNGSEGDQVQSPHDSLLLGGHTSDKDEDALNLEELFSICTNLSNRVLTLETVKDAQAAEIIALKARIKKLEKK
nr:hypothetical protein [Tanacetum cinerariifolium]